MSEFTPFVHSSQGKVRIKIKYLLLEVEGRKAQGNSGAETHPVFMLCVTEVTLVWPQRFQILPFRSQKGDVNKMWLNAPPVKPPAASRWLGCLLGRMLHHMCKQVNTVKWIPPSCTDQTECWWSQTRERSIVSRHILAQELIWNNLRMRNNSGKVVNEDEFCFFCPIPCKETKVGELEKK